jgi:triosephosphate isomerase
MNGPKMGVNKSAMQARRRPILAGNWKMHGTLHQSELLTRRLVQLLGDLTDVEVVVCPPYTALIRVKALLTDCSIQLGAQDVHWELEGAYTGEISPLMLQEIGCTYTIVGHSERRHLLNETDAMIRRKVKGAVSSGLKVILCVGETLKERQANQTWSAIERQLEEDLADFPKAVSPTERLVVAYEPVWAIGTGHNATGAQAQAVHAQIRQWLSHRFDPTLAQAIRIVYGGSVKPDNASELLGQSDVDGALVGGASLNPEAFALIVRTALCSTA